jgi:O-antigen/teichoic acid export membrane protein
LRTRYGLVARRSATAVAIYAAAALGLASAIVAARLLGPGDFGAYALVLATTGFFQVLLDSTVEEAAVKYGYRYAGRGDWGRLRRLFRVGLALKLAGGAAAAVLVAAVAPLADPLFGTEGLLVPLLIAAAIPLVQAPESLAGAALLIRGRYDLRGVSMAVAMALRLAGVAVGAQYGVTEAVLGILAGQVLATAVVGVAGWAAFSRFPAAAPAGLGPDRAPLRRFILQSAAATSLVSARTSLTPLLVGLVATPLQVGYFRAAQAPVTGAHSLSAPARLVLLTEQTRDFEGGRIDRVYRLLGRYMLATTGLVVALLPLLWWFMPDLVRLLYTAAFLPAVDAARLIAVAGAIWIVFGWTKSFPVSIGRPGLRILGHGLEIVVLVPLVVVLASRWGATGAAAAVLAATVAFAALWAGLLVKLRRDHLGLAPGSRGVEASAP